MTQQFDLSKYKISPLAMVFLVEGDKVLTLRRNDDKKIYPGLAARLNLVKTWLHRLAVSSWKRLA